MKRWIAAGLVFVVSLASCGPKEKPPEKPAAPVVPPAPGPLRVGIEAKYPPFESTTASGDFEGFDIDLVRALGASLDRTVEFKDMAWDSLIPELQAGRIDLVCSGMSYTDERAQVVDFSEPYAQAPMSVLVSVTRAPEVTKLEQLNGETIHIAAQRGTTGEKKAKAAFPKALIMAYDTESDAGREVAAGRVHAFVYDYLSVEKIAKQYPGQVRILDEGLGAEQYCMVMAKGSPLRPRVDAFLDAAKKPDGTLDTLMKKWLPSPEKLRAGPK
jgi:ABC-type amino acid transport substrate-binding protein